MRNTESKFTKKKKKKTSSSELLHLGVEAILVAGRHGVFSLLSVADRVNQRRLRVRVEHSDPVCQITPELKRALRVKVRRHVGVHSLNDSVFKNTKQRKLSSNHNVLKRGMRRTTESKSDHLNVELGFHTRTAGHVGPDDAGNRAVLSGEILRKELRQVRGRVILSLKLCHCLRVVQTARGKVRNVIASAKIARTNRTSVLAKKSSKQIIPFQKKPSGAKNKDFFSAGK